MAKRKNKQSPFLKPLGRKQAKKEMRAALRLAYGKADRSLDKEIRSTGVQQRRTRDYFDTYGDQINAAASRTEGAYEKAQSSINQNSMQAANYSEQIRQRLAQEAQADAARRGVPYDPSGAHTFADANLARVNAANTLSAVTGTQGAAQGAYYADKARIGQRESIEQQRRIQDRARSLRQEKRDLSGDKAAQIAGMLATLRDSERDFYLGKKAAQQPGRERAHERKQSARDRRFNRKQAGKDRRFDRAEARKDRRHDKATGSSSSSSGKSPEDRRETRDDIQRIIGLLSSSKPKQQAKYDESKKQAIRDILNEARSFSGKEARKGYKKWKKQRDKFNPWV